MSLSQIKVNNQEVLGIVTDLSAATNGSVPTSNLLNRTLGIPFIVSYDYDVFILIDFNTGIISTAPARIFVRLSNSIFLDITLNESEIALDGPNSGSYQLWYLFLDKVDKNFRLVNYVYSISLNFSNAERYLMVGFGIPNPSEKRHNFTTAVPVKIGDIVIYPNVYSTELLKVGNLIKDLPAGTINLLNCYSPNIYKGYSQDGINWELSDTFWTSDYIAVNEGDLITNNTSTWIYTYDADKNPLDMTDIPISSGYGLCAGNYAIVKTVARAYFTVPGELKYIKQIFYISERSKTMVVKYPYNTDTYVPYSPEYRVNDIYLPPYPEIPEIETNYLRIKPFVAYNSACPACVEINTTTFQITVKSQDIWYMEDDGRWIRFLNLELKTNDVIATSAYSTFLLYYIFFDKTELTFQLVHFSDFESNPNKYNTSRYVCFGEGLFRSNYFSTMSSIIIDGVLYPSIVPEPQPSVSSGNIQDDFTISEIGNLDIPYPEEADYCQILLYGQSLSMGWECPEAITTTARPDCYMVGSSPMTNHGNDNTTVLNPLVAVKSTVGGEQPIVGITNAFANLYKRWRLAANQKFIGTSAGEGGRSIEQLSKPCTNGTNYYTTEFTKAITNTKTAVGSSSIVCSAIVYMQGEHNYTGSGLGMTPGTEATKDKNTYKSLLRQLKEDMQTDIMTKYNQQKKPLFFCYMVAGAYINIKDMPINMAMIELAEEDDDVFILNSTYGVPDYNGGHLSTNGYRWYGELVAHTLYNVFVRGLKHEPVMPKSFNVSQNNIYIDCYCPVKLLVIDIWTKESVVDYGFRVYKNDYDVSITNISVQSNRIVLTLSEDVSTGKLEVTYAGMGRAGTGNVRDSDEFYSLYTYYDDRESAPSKRENYTPKDESGNYIYGKRYPMYNWLANFYKLVRQS